MCRVGGVDLQLAHGSDERHQHAAALEQRADRRDSAQFVCLVIKVDGSGGGDDEQG